ncbi:MAG: HAD family hydrolase [Chloroflexi bacterium]|nr:HAD family hydrolase [Chloroflexota bacterium]
MAYIPNTQIEIVREVPRGRIQHALFDFDGTISLIREGWQQVMIPLMVEVLLETPQHESEAALTEVVTEFVDRLTGKQTIYQMLQLVEEVAKRGGQPKEALDYKWMYLDRLWERIKHRVAGLKEGALHPPELVVPGALELLEMLRQRGITCYLASGTDHKYVTDEAGALGVTPYFAGGVYGALDNYQDFSKAKLIEQILRNHDLQGPELVVFGDGFVEIENAKAVGGIAVGVASDEERRVGINDWKRHRLLQAGADIIIPDFREGPRLLDYLCGEE